MLTQTSYWFRVCGCEYTILKDSLSFSVNIKWTQIEKRKM